MKNFLNLIHQEFRTEWRTKERILSPFIFSLIVLIFFAFCFTDIPDESKSAFFIGMLTLTLFFALQIYLSRGFETEMEDDAFDLMRCAKIPATPWYLAKLSATVLLSTLVIVPISFFGSIIFNPALTVNQIALITLYLIVGSIGVTSIGILLAAITARSASQKIIFPILFFPLSVPVLLSLEYGSLQWIDKKAFGTTNWVYLLIAFDVIYVTLGWLLFHEIVATDDGER